MSTENPRYDVAISFLYEDLALAKAIFDQLSNGLEVFFFPRNQEELAGTEGLESMREPFRHESRINLVLYRPKWGKTPWTGVEEAAVKESCLATSYRSIFFFVIEPTDEIPAWLPETHVRFNYADFTLEQAVGAIKARVQERGGHYKPMTPARKAAILEAEEDYQCARRSIFSSDGIMRIFENVKILFAEIVKQCEEVNSGGHVSIEHHVKIQYGDIDQTCLLGEHRIGMAVIWLQRYSNTLDDSAALIVREFNENLIVPPGYMRIRQPAMIKETKYDPELSRAREYGWKPKAGKEAFVSSKDLASHLVLQFLEMIERDRAGKIKRNSPY